MTPIQIQTVRIVFKTAIRAFDTAEDVLKMAGKQPSWKHIEMKKLHQQALDLLDEIEKSDGSVPTNTINALRMNWLITQMEMLAAQPEKQLKQGGITYK